MLRAAEVNHRPGCSVWLRGTHSLTLAKARRPNPSVLRLPRCECSLRLLRSLPSAQCRSTAPPPAEGRPRRTLAPAPIKLYTQAGQGTRA